MEYFSFGPWLGHCRCTFLKDLSDCKRGLVFGDGDGRFAAKLLNANHEIELDVVDASEAMLRTLRNRVGAEEVRVRTQCLDARDWQPHDGGYDLVITHFFLDCLGAEEIEALAERVRGLITPSARWVISEFAVSESWFGRLVAGPVVWMLYRAFGLLTGLQVDRLPEFATALQNAGFTCERRRCWLNGLLVSEVWCADRNGFLQNTGSAGSG